MKYEILTDSNLGAALTQKNQIPGENHIPDAPAGAPLTPPVEAPRVNITMKKIQIQTDSS